MKKFTTDFSFTKAPLLEGGYDVLWEDKILCTIARFGNEINIQAIQSKHQNKGNCQRFVKEFKTFVEEKGQTLVSSTPINPAWRHICKKFNLKIYEEILTIHTKKA